MLLAICWKEKRKTGVFGYGRKKEVEKAMADEEVIVPMEAIYRPRVGKMNRLRSAGAAFTPGFN